MSGENPQNNNNLATTIIIWLAGIMILVVGGVYLLGENEDKRNLNRAKCESDFFAQADRARLGKWDSVYQSKIKKCIKTGRYGY